MDIDSSVGTETPPVRSRRHARVGGAWLEASIECSATNSDLFDLALSLRAADGPLVTPALQERYSLVSLEASHPRYAPTVLAGSEIAGIAGMLAAADAEPAEPGRARRLHVPAVRPRSLAAAFALLAFLFPGIALVPAVAHADDGTTTGTGTTTTAPAETTPTGTTPTDTTTEPTATTPDPTEPPPTPTDPTTTEPAPTEPAPTETIPDYKNYRPSTSAPAKTITVPVKPQPKRAEKKQTAKPDAGKAEHPEIKKPEQEVVGETQTIAVPQSLLDPTPPALRLAPAFAENLTVAAAGAHVDWAVLLGVIRARGGISSTPVSEPVLERLALHLGRLEPARNAETATLTMLGSHALSARALALANYYRGVGLPTLVHGLKWAQPALEKKVLADGRVTIYPGGREDIARHRIDVRVVALVEYLAQTYDQVTVSCLISGHRLYARPGVISAHHYGRAVDISVVRNTPIAYHQEAGGITESAIKSILQLPPEMMPNQVISLLALGGPSFALSNHWDHIHVGFAPALGIVPGTGAGVSPSDGSAGLVHLWQAAGAAYGVPWQVLGAINKIESNFGQNMGPSSAGAIGWMQFLPSSWERWGIDASGDGIANPYDPADAVFSAARYLQGAGAGTNLPRAIFAYNHAQWYVSEVLQLATLFGGASPEMFATLYAPGLLSDNDISPAMQHNLAMVPDPPTSAFMQRALGMDDEARGLPLMSHPLLSTGVAMLTDLLADAQQALPQATATVDLNARALAFHTMAGEPEAAYQVSVRRSLADRSVLAGLPRVVLPVALLRDRAGVTQAASASATSSFEESPSSSTGTR